MKNLNAQGKNKTDWKRGRTKLPESDKRENRIRVSFNDAELAQLEKSAGGMSVSCLLRLLATTPGILPKPIPSINAEAWSEMSRIGKNINQIAVKLNATGRIEIREFKEELATLRLRIVDAY